MIYLDHAATSLPRAPGVAEAVAGALELGSPGRGGHAAAREASRLQFEAREACAAGLGLEAARLVFTGGATEALNLAILGTVPDGGTVVCSSLEHDAVMRPLRDLEARRGVTVRVVPFDPWGRPDRLALILCLLKGADLMVLTAASNVTGALTPAEEIATLCRREGVPLLLDASQLAGHRPLPVGWSALACPGHKGLRGPTGTGLLALAEDFRPRPLRLGGTGGSVDLPDALEAGTPNLPGIAGLGAAVRSVTGQCVAERTCAALVQGLAELPGVTILGPGPEEVRAPLVSVTVEGRDPVELAMELDRRGVCVRGGLHCAVEAHRDLGTWAGGGALRLSTGATTTADEVAGALAALAEVLAWD